MVKIPVSVVIPVKNDAKNLAKCLPKLKQFSEIIVVDSNSLDNTSELTEENNVQLINFCWNGYFPKKRNWVLENVKLKHDWVLFLDADEQVTNDFIKELQQAIKSPKYVGFRLNYINHFMGKKLRFGDRMQKLALFRHSSGRYEKIEEVNWSNLDMEVHEHPILNGSIGRINAPLIHNDFNGLHHYLAKHNEYSTWEAKRYNMLHKDNITQLSLRQQIKYSLLKNSFFPYLYFLFAFIGKFGFLDGKSGYYFAKLKAQYFFQIRLKLIELDSAK